MCTVNIMDDTNDNDVLFIFTDGSYNNCKNIGAAMAALYIGGDILKTQSPILENCIRLKNLTSSTEAELYAIMLGLDLLAEYLKSNSNIKRIYLLSDNIIAINGLRDWIFNWSYDNDGYSGNNKIANSRLYTEIVMSINRLNYSILFHHIKGHSYNKYFKQSDYKNILDKFNFHNNYDYDNRYLNVVASFSKCNHIVDTMQDNKYNHKSAITPIHFEPANESMYDALTEYEQLQGGSLHGFDEEIWE